MNTENKLPEDFKRKWVKALRSGKYKKGFSYLKIESGGEFQYCCLGVACEISGGNFKRQDGNYPHKDNTDIPAMLRGRNKVTNKLAFMNDGIDETEKSFAEIADYIEENL